VDGILTEIVDVQKVDRNLNTRGIVLPTQTLELVFRPALRRQPREHLPRVVRGIVLLWRRNDSECPRGPCRLYQPHALLPLEPLANADGVDRNAPALHSFAGESLEERSREHRRIEADNALMLGQGGVPWPDSRLHDRQNGRAPLFEERDQPRRIALSHPQMMPHFRGVPQNLVLKRLCLLLRQSRQ